MTRPWTRHVRVVRRMIETGTNTVITSSCGRLFDAVAALIGLRQEVNFEGQAAIELEAIADSLVRGALPLRDQAGEEVDFRPMIERIVSERRGVAPRDLRPRFHNTVAESTAEVCRRIAAESGLQRVCLSGGTFQNIRLLAATARDCARRGSRSSCIARSPPTTAASPSGRR